MARMKILCFGIIPLMIMLTSCSGATKLSSGDQAATAQIIAATIIAQTEQAVLSAATSTSPPTETVTPTQISTSTPTLEVILLPTETNSYIPPTPTVTPFLSTNMVTPVKFINQSGKSVYFMFTSPIQEEYTFSGSFNIQLPFGTYLYLAWIGDDGPYSGSFEIKGYNKIEIIIKTDKIKIVYP